jgi:hypothetical protein
MKIISKFALVFVCLHLLQMNKVMAGTQLVNPTNEQMVDTVLGMIPEENHVYIKKWFLQSVFHSIIAKYGQETPLNQSQHELALNIIEELMNGKLKGECSIIPYDSDLLAQIMPFWEKERTKKSSGADPKIFGIKISFWNRFDKSLGEPQNIGEAIEIFIPLMKN